MDGWIVLFSLVLTGNAVASQTMKHPANPLDELLPCIYPRIRGLVYRFETHLLANRKIKIGCDIQYGAGILQSDDSRFAKVLRFYVTDADGTEKQVSKKKCVSIRRNNDTSSPEVQEEPTCWKWNQIGFPGQCYMKCVGNQQTGRDDSLEDRHLGRIYKYSLKTLYCQQGNRTVLTSASLLPISRDDQVIDYRFQSKSLAEPHVRYEYRYQNDYMVDDWVGCSLRRPLASPNTVVRTFLYGREWSDSHTVPANLALLGKANQLYLSQEHRKSNVTMRVNCLPNQCLTPDNQECLIYLRMYYSLTIFNGKHDITLIFEEAFNIQMDPYCSYTDFYAS